MNKVAIIGTGVMGRVLAIRLAEKYPNLILDIYDKSLDYKATCSYCAGGMLSPISELITCDKHVYELGYDSYELWLQIEEFLMGNLSVKTKFVKKADTYIVAHNQDRQELDLAVRNISFRAAGLSNELMWRVKKPFQFCYSQQIKNQLDLSANISEKALRLEEAFVDVKKFFELSSNFFERSINTNLFELDKQDFYSQNLDKNYKYIFDCTGMGCDKLQQVYGVRGEGIVLEKQGIDLDSVIRLLHPRHSIYLIPRGNGIFYIGSTSIASDDTSNISVQSTLELLSSLMILDKRFTEARIIKTIVNVRPTSIDDKPIIKKINNTVYLNGLSRHGYLFSPRVADMAITEIYV